MVEQSRQIETERLILRLWKDDDFLPLRKINADPRVMEFYPGVLSSEASDKVIEGQRRQLARYGFCMFAAELKITKELIGWVGLQNVPFEAHFTPAVEIGWRIAFEHWNKGYATEGAKKVLGYAFTELKLPEVVAMTYLGNHRSRRVMEKLEMSYDSNDDFDNPHPLLKDTWLRPHVLYRIGAKTV